MSDYNFDISERYPVWKILGPKCCWCGEPVSFPEFHCDHVIPEYIIGDKTKLDQLKGDYNLHPDFEINSFYNWAPLHSSCNTKKSKAVFEGMPVIGQLFKRIEAKYDQVIKEHKKWKGAPEEAKLLAMLEAAIKHGVTTKGIVDKYLNQVPVNLPPKEVIKGLKFAPHPIEMGWDVQNEIGDQYFVTKDGKGGYISKDLYPDISWLCGHCKFYGPWAGNRCLTCGQMSAPD